MRPASTGIDTGATYYRAGLLIEIGGSTTYRWCSVPFPVTATFAVGGALLFTQRPFRVGDIVQDDAGTGAAEIAFEDQSDVIKAIAFLESFAKRPVKLWEVHFDENRLPIGEPQLLLYGRTNGIRVMQGGTIAAIPVLPGSPAFKTVGPRRRYTVSCGWTFKHATTCGYSGPATECNRTYTRCTELLNTVRFGGFRHAPTPGTVVTWGGGRSVIQLRNYTFPVAGIPWNGGGE